MHDYDLIAARFGFQVPLQYRAVRDAALLVPDGSSELNLTDLRWMTPDAIARYDPLECQIEGLVPFAYSARRDHFCWYPAWAVGDAVPVVFCPRDEENADCYAADFTAFLYRVLLEEFSGSWLVDSFGVDGTAERFRRYARDVSPFLPGEWARILVDLSSLPLTELEEGVHGVITRRKCDELIAEFLSFPRLGQKFKHYV